MRAATAVKVLMVALIFGAAVGVGKVHATFIGDYELTASSRIQWMLAYAAIVSVLAYAVGLPERVSWGSAAVAGLVPPILVAVVQTSVGAFFLPRFFLVMTVPVTIAVFFVSARLSRIVRRTTADRERVVLFCSAEEARRVRGDVEFHTEIPCSIIAVFDPVEGLDVDAVRVACGDLEATFAVYTAEAAEHPQVLEVLTAIHLRGVRVRDLTSFYDTFIGKVPIRELESTALLFDIREVHHPVYYRVKRLTDLFLASIGLIVLGIVIPFVAVGNLLANRGPLFYAQERVGKLRRTFRILKFRTMTPGGSSTQWTERDDPRITRFGRFLRTTHIDELPQVVNILRGELTLVGPRPEQPHYVDELVTLIPFYAARHLVRPGLTGWAQVNYPYGANRTDAFEKLQYEFWYLRHQQTTLDLKILARTVRHVFGFQGR